MTQNNSTPDTVNSNSILCADALWTLSALQIASNFVTGTSRKTAARSVDDLRAHGSTCALSVGPVSVKKTLVFAGYSRRYGRYGHRYSITAPAGAVERALSQTVEPTAIAITTEDGATVAYLLTAARGLDVRLVRRVLVGGAL